MDDAGAQLPQYASQAPLLVTIAGHLNRGLVLADEQVELWNGLLAGFVDHVPIIVYASEDEVYPTIGERPALQVIEI